MAVKDIRSNLQHTVANAAAVTGDGTTTGVAVDTQAFELGLMFTSSVSNYTDGTYNFTLQSADDSAFTVNLTNHVDGDDNMIGTLAGMTQTAANANSDVLKTVGLFSNRQFVRMNVVATVVTTGADVTVIATEKGENMPVV